jgi:uncharacterized protein with HEPN domain
MPKHNDEVYVKHILEAADKINQLVNRGGKELYESDFAISDAIVRELLVIGEACRHVSKDFKDQNTNIPWKEAIGMRDWLVHGYSEIDWNRVWNTAITDIPSLIKLLKTNN